MLRAVATHDHVELVTISRLGFSKVHFALFLCDFSRVIYMARFMLSVCFVLFFLCESFCALRLISENRCLYSWNSTTKIGPSKKFKSKEYRQLFHDQKICGCKLMSSYENRRDVPSWNFVSQVCRIFNSPRDDSNLST